MKNSMFISPLSTASTKTAHQRPTIGKNTMPEFTAPTRNFTPRRSLLLNTQDVLAAKQLLIQRDPVTGYLRSKDGRKNDLNTPLAVSLGMNYPYFESMHGRLRQIAATDLASGLIQYNDVGLPKKVLCEQVDMLCQAGVINRYAAYATGLFVELNKDAHSFITKGFAQLHLIDHIKQHKHPDELFYDVHLGETRGAPDTYVIDVMHREGSSVKFTLIALNQHLDKMPQQIDRLVRIANRLRSSVTIVVSPSIDVQAFSIRFNNMIDSRTSAVSVVPFTRHALLP